MERWHTRLLRKIKELGWSKAEFARRTALPRDTVYKYLAGKVKRPPDERVIAIMAKTVGWTPPQLMYGKAASNGEEPATMRQIPWIDWGDVGMLGHDQGGAKSLKEKGRMPVPEDGVNDGAFYTEAPNDANAPDINRGDLLLCQPGRQPIPGRYVLAMIKGHGEPILAKYTVDSYCKGAPAIIALVYADKRNYGRHEAKATDVHILGIITHRTSRMVPPDASV